MSKQEVLKTFYETTVGMTVKTNDSENENHQRTNWKKRKYKSKSNELIDTNNSKTDGKKINSLWSEENPVNFSAAL